jgi:ADP-ribose pyrophosphatase YjhB (NUDIX family)
VVKERSKAFASWKLPGGYLNLGEDLEVGVAREILEETGVQTRFDRVLTFRHQHKVQFGRSDIYVICKLDAVTTDITVDAEIEEARWMDLAEFAASTKHPMLQRALALINGTKGLTGDKMKSTIPGKEPFTLYSPL